MTTAPDGRRLIRGLRELAVRTSDRNGAQRLAWSERWKQARGFLTEELQELPVTVTIDEAGNLWAVLQGRGDGTLVVGSHLDSVPDGGWLDGAFGVMCALEVLRVLAQQGEPTRSVALVDWADEEGARFGYSLFGSAAATGRLDVDAVRDLVDRDGRRLPDVLADCGVGIDQMARARQRLEGVTGYLEAHIEQGPVLEAEGLAIGAVSGTVGLERHRVTFLGATAHSGSTPMDRRRDSFLAAARTALAVREGAVREGGVGTVGTVDLSPGIPTAVAGETVVLVDQRHPDGARLQAMVDGARAASERSAEDEGCSVRWERVMGAGPQPFDESLVETVRGVCWEVGRSDRVLVSGALHDATNVASVVPTAMIFASSRDGISHSKAEDSDEDALKLGLEGFWRTVLRLLE